jgi:hypothetical protein
MNLQDQVIYRCIHAACARQLPRRVNFCPWCGTGQHDGVDNPAHVARPAPMVYQAAYQEEAPAEPEAHAVPEAVIVAAAVPEMAPAPVQIAEPPPAPPPPPSQPAAAKPGSFGAAVPPKREPVRLRWWLVALAALWLIWIYARPNTAKKIESRIDSAMTASAECRLNDAQSELIALRMTRATPEQLTRLQKAIDAASATCGKKKLREKAWTDTTTAVENALAEGDFAKAQARLLQFTKRWNEDDDTRKLKSRISERRAAAPPLAPLPLPEVVERSRPVPSVSARNLIDEAERALRAGNYRAAVDKLETCITMVDEGARECAAFKVHADRMLRERERCASAGRIWVEDRCT